MRDTGARSVTWSVTRAGGATGRCWTGWSSRPSPPRADPGAGRRAAGSGRNRPGTADRIHAGNAAGRAERKAAAARRADGAAGGAGDGGDEPRGHYAPPPSSGRRPGCAG
ncbi:hypothetical protein NKH77_34225 [Streptomyces sp. M19]